VLLLASAVASAAPDSQVVQLRGDFFGVRFDTPLRIQVAHPVARTPVGVLEADRRALAPMAKWIDASAEAVDLDDYGRLMLVVTALDALPVRVAALDGPPRSVSEALQSGVWTATDRLLAIGGGLRAVGVDVNVFTNRRGHTLLGVRALDEDLNVNAVRQRWAVLSGGVRSEAEVNWVLWDGAGAIGRLGPGEIDGVRAQLKAAPTGRGLRFGDRAVPDFALRRTRPASLSLADSGRRLEYVQHPDAAGYLALFPELRFAAQVGLARRELRRLGLDRAVRQAVADAPTEVALVDTLIRTLQESFVYEPGPVRSLHELADRGRGDCDQLSLLLAAMLLEVGYDGDDVVGVQWEDHLGLALRARDGVGPPGGSGVDLAAGRYHLVDVTHYVYENGQLASRWGRTAPEHGRQVEILPLDVGRAR
jgi:hypothetical protein